MGSSAAGEGEAPPHAEAVLDGVGPRSARSDASARLESESDTAGAEGGGASGLPPNATRSSASSGSPPRAVLPVGGAELGTVDEEDEEGARQGSSTSSVVPPQGEKEGDKGPAEMDWEA